MRLTLAVLAFTGAIVASFVGCRSAQNDPSRVTRLTSLEAQVRSQLSETMNTSNVTVTAVGGTVYLEGVPPGMENQAVRLTSRVSGVSRVVIGTPPADRYLCPYFPWPPPQASAFRKIPRSLVAQGNNVRLQTVADILENALTDAGYSEATFFAAPDGFAIATRMEQIDTNGYPKAGTERWAPKVSPPPMFSTDYFRALLRGRPGQYRVIVFLVTPYTVTMAERIAPPPDFQNIYSRGATALPRAIAKLRFTADYSVTAFIYEFSKTDHEEEWKLVVPSLVSGKDHMDRSGIISMLESRHGRK